MTSEIRKIDSIDARILGVLQDNADLSIQQIGDMVGLSANPCWRRIKRMESEGVIERRIALVNPAAIGLGLTAFVTIRIGQHDAGWLDHFHQAIRGIAEILECHRMSGDIDYLLKVVVSDIAHYDRVYKRLIVAVPGLIDVTSTFSMERLKHGTRLDLTTLSDRP